MKLFTLTLDTVFPGADHNGHLDSLALSTELLASHDCVVMQDENGQRIKLLKASIEVWNLSQYLVPERTPGTALLVLDFPTNSHITVHGGEQLGERLVRLVGNQSCVIEHRWAPSRLGFRESDVNDTNMSRFNASFTGCFLKVERNGRLMQPDSVIL